MYKARPVYNNFLKKIKNDKTNRTRYYEKLER